MSEEETIISRLHKTIKNLGGDHVAFINTEINGKEKKRYTYSQLLQRCEGVARALLKHNVCKQQRTTATQQNKT